MAIVEGPFFSLYASGSFGKLLTVKSLFQGNKFVFAGYKRYTGKRYPIQEENARIFKARVKAFYEVV